MKTRGKVLLFTLLAAAFLMSAQVAHAYSGAWLANSDDVFSVDLTVSTSDFIGFSVYDWNDSTNFIELLSDSAELGDSATFTISKHDDGTGGYTYSLTFVNQKIDLGNTAEFGFFFGTYATGNDYTVVQSGMGGDSYKLTFGSSVVKVHDANPVPIPPSALLLGSGVLGMIGFGFRRKSRKA